MKIAVAYDNGNIFQHFGRTECFKVYETENGNVISSEILESNGEGHGALAGLLADNTIDVLICGGIGSGAQDALAEAGIEVCSGAEGSADDAVAAFLGGELESAGTTCSHHDHEEGHSCGGGGCGSSCGGCGPRVPAFDGKNVGKTVRVHYRGTFDDGTQFDSSYDRGETLDFVCGAGMMIQGFDKAVADMNEGDEIDVHLMPEEAYGPKDPSAIFTLAIANLPGSEDLNVGEHVYLTNQFGQPIPVTVLDKDDDNITLDANHEMAGKELNFHIELVEVL